MAWPDFLYVPDSPVINVVSSPDYPMLVVQFRPEDILSRKNSPVRDSLNEGLFGERVENLVQQIMLSV